MHGLVKIQIHQHKDAQINMENKQKYSHIGTNKHKKYRDTYTY